VVPGFTKNFPLMVSLTTNDFALVKSNVKSDILDMTNLVGTLRDYFVSIIV